MTSASVGPHADDESRAAGGEPAIERVLAIGGMTGADERIGNRRPAEAAARQSRRAHQRVHVDGAAEIGKAAADLPDAIEPRRPLPLEESGQPAVVWIEEVAEDVDVAAAFDRGDLDPVDEPQTGARPRPRAPRPVPRRCRDR